jgi:hypothetical protein
MKHLLLVPLAALLVISCDRPKCRNTNPVFDRYAPETNEYKSELIKELKKVSAKKISYWIDKYSMKDSIEYMSVDIQDGTLCAKAIFNITHSESLEQYKKVKGLSYRGAGLAGFKYHIDSTNGTYNFIFDHVAWIVD